MDKQVAAMLDQGTILCSGSELYYLAMLLEGERIIGIADPFPGWLTEEIADALEQASATLAQRGYLAEQPAGEPAIDQRIAAMVDALVFPSASMLVTLSTQDGQSEEHAFHVKDPLPLAIEVTPTDQAYRLEALGGARAVFERIVALWQLQGQAPAAAEPVSLPEAVLADARTAAAQHGIAAAEQLLLSSGIGAQTAHSLAETLATAVRNGALVIMNRTEAEPASAGLGMLDGPHGLWRLRGEHKNGAPYLQLAPMGGGQLIGELHELMASMVEFALIPAPEA